LRLAFVAAFEPVNGVRQSKLMPLINRTAPKVTRAVFGAEEFLFIGGWVGPEVLREVEYKIFTVKM
jgi:hypothetical protein